MIPQSPQIVSYHFYELLAAAVHEPDFELDLAWQLIVEGTTCAGPVVSAKDWLLELFVVGQGQGQVDSLEFRLALGIDKHNAHSGHDDLALALELAHTFDFELEFNTEPLEAEMFALHAQGLIV